MLRRVAARRSASPRFPRTVLLWALRIGLIAAFVGPHRRRVPAHADEPEGPADEVPVASATTWPPTSRRARCGGRASSSACSSSSTCSTSRGARPTRTSCAATPTTTCSTSFERVPVAIVYIVANLALGIHIFHGAWSMFQSLGLEQPALQHLAPLLRDRVRAWSSRIGNVSMPLLVVDGGGDQMIGDARRRGSPRGRSRRSGTTTSST